MSKTAVTVERKNSLVNGMIENQSIKFDLRNEMEIISFQILLFPPDWGDEVYYSENDFSFCQKKETLDSLMYVDFIVKCYWYIIIFILRT